MPNKLTGYSKLQQVSLGFDFAQSAEHRRGAASPIISGEKRRRQSFGFSGAFYLTSIGRQFSDNFRESTTGAIRCIRQAKIFENLQKPLLLIKETGMFPGSIGLAEEALAYDHQSPVA